MKDFKNKSKEYIIIKYKLKYFEFFIKNVNKLNFFRDSNQYKKLIIKMMKVKLIKLILIKKMNLYKNKIYNQKKY